MREIFEDLTYTFVTVSTISGLINLFYVENHYIAENMFKMNCILALAACFTAIAAQLTTTKKDQ